jgi:hypothetical protein
LRAAPQGAAMVYPCTPEAPPPDNPFNLLTPEQALTQLNIAIGKAETSQRYKIGDREIQRGDLRWMYPERARLEKQVAQRMRGGIKFRRVVPL